MGAYRPDLASESGGGWQEVRLVSCDTFWSTAEGRRCTLEIFWSSGAGNVARVKQFAEVVQADGSVESTEIQNPVTCRLPDDSKDYMLEFIQNFTENKTMNGYAHVATTAAPAFPQPAAHQHSLASQPELDVQRSASAAYSEGNFHADNANHADNGNSQDDPQDQNAASQKKGGAFSGFDLNEVSQYFHLPIHEAAAKLGVGETWLKQKCRDSGIRRWPYRKVKSMDKIIQRLKAQIKEGASTLSDSQARHLQDQIREAEHKRRQFCLDAMSGADDSCNLAHDSPARCPEVPTPESAITSFGHAEHQLPPLKRIRTDRTDRTNRAARTSSGLSAQFNTPKKQHLLSPLPKPMHHSFPGVTDAGLEALLSSPAALRLARDVATPSRGSMLTPHFLGSPLKFNIDFNF